MNEEKVNVEKKSLKLKDGLIVFVISMLFFVFLGSYVQSIAIIPGLLFTEFGIALIPIVYLKCKKLSIKEVMRFKFPKLKWIFLSIGAYIASYIVMIIVMMFIVAFFPDSLDQIQGLNKVLDFGNVGLEILIIGLLPAICEEVLFRGFIFSSFIKKVKGEPSEKDKITRIVKIKEKYGKCRFETQIIDNRQRKNALFAMILSGFLFGGMHIYPIKILPVSILGITFAYVVYKSGSIFTSMMLHFINNAMSVFFMNIFPTTSILYKTALITRIDNIEMIRIVIFVVIVVLVLEKFIKNRLNLSEIL